MPPLRQPLTLEKLTLAAVSDYVHNVGKMVFHAICTVSSPVVTPKEETLKEEKFNLEPLSTALYRNIPHVLWFDVTANVLYGINQLIRNAFCSTDGFGTSGDQRCKNFIEELIMVLIAPHVTHVDFTNYAPFLRHILVKNLDKMQHIKVLKLLGVKSEDVVKEHLAFLTSLTSFTMEQNCTDEIIQVLANNCKKLQTLNVTGSLGVTNKSILNILRLFNLQNLQMSCTKISEKGILCILKPKDISSGALKELDTLKNLRALGCGQIRNDQLLAIAHSLLGLTHISLSTVRCDFKILSQMKHLKELKVSCGSFPMDNMAGLLEAAGHQLEILDLLMVQDVDLGVIATHCFNLKTLSLRSCSIAPLPLSPMLFTKCDKGPPFHKLERLTFYVPCDTKFLEFILVRCIALRCLVIGQMREVNDNFISSCLSRNPLKKLELFKVYFGAQISLRSVRLLLESCPNLSILGGLGTSDRIQLHRLSKLIEYLKHKNYDISIIR